MEEFFDEFEKYKDNSEMIRILNVLKFFSELHKKPEYADVLRFIYLSSYSRSEKGLAPVRKSPGPGSFRVFFARAMMAATAIGSFDGMRLVTPDGTTTKMLTKELLFGNLHCLCSEYDIGTEILREELKLIFSVWYINDPCFSEFLLKLLKAKPHEGYSSYIGKQLENLLTSAIELLSE